ncbi:MAG: hypothetical protein H0T42_30405 [Deltaproteobacteria bacterium]|nr:hypothetical protein [Deltaproteobacteria bacterium]
MNRIAIVFAFVVVLVGCKEEKPTPKYEFRADWKLLIEIRNAMCACKDQACASAVLARKTKWSAEIATRDYKPSPVQIKDADNMSKEIDACMAKAMRGVTEPIPSGSASTAPSGKPTPSPTKAALPAAAPTPATVDQLLALARDFAPTEHAQLAIASIDAEYVDVDGKLDDDNGSLTVILGTAAPTDDPNRRVGAPAKPRPTPPSTCTKLIWKQASGWVSEPYGCIEAQRPFPRCQLAEIWKRALAKAVPKDGLAVIQLREATPRQWVFTMVDEPRKLNIQHSLPDDCELKLEKH